MPWDLPIALSAQPKDGPALLSSSTAPSADDCASCTKWSLDRTAYWKGPLLSADIPELVSVFVDGAPGPGPYAAKAVAELSNVTVPAAIANAVARACGARVSELPISAERVLAALRHDGTVHAG